MKFKSLLLIILVVILGASFVSADDGQMFRRNISKTPAGETEEANIQMMRFYVPAQMASGDPSEGIEYYDGEGVLVETRYDAKPLVAIYIDEEHHEEDVELAFKPMAIDGGAGFGMRDAFASVSLDDGETWKGENLSDSADESSFTLKDGHEYPGDVVRMEFAVVGNKVLAAWVSKYCSGGNPAYTATDDDDEPLFADLFGVAGSQKSVDYTLQGFPEVGEIPYGCVWTARGTLEFVQELASNGSVESEGYELVWRKAERLTSGRRDPNRVEVIGVPDAGFSLVWQEDPDGLRPGQGLGPGEGWSGAVVNQKTDIWYSTITWNDFDTVLDADGNPIDWADYVDEEKPKVGVNMAMPVRVTDNNFCNGDERLDDDGTLRDAYCYEDFDGNGTADACATTESWTNPGGSTKNVCITEGGIPLMGRSGASRPRLGLKPYNKEISDGAGGTMLVPSAWFVMAYEESKALGEGTTDEDVEPIDIGKNIWYHSFDMFEPNLVSHGNMLNQPASDPETGNLFEVQFDDWDNAFYETEIARRFNIIVQSADLAGDSGTVLFTLFKQGVVNQGGPADIFARRFVLPEDFAPYVDNPFAFENMVCDEWAYADGSNPNYPDGLCMSDPINLSGTNATECEGGSDCPALLPADGEGDYPRVSRWEQTVDNLDDQSWEGNPFDVAKGHRGFMDGDFIMVIYAWSPNWRQNSVGNDHYNLYARRSFDGGQTWTTTPESLDGDGTETCELYVDPSTHGRDLVCTTYGAGEFEQARNLSQLDGYKITILDPRYSPSGGMPVAGDILQDDGTTLYDDDVRDPSRFFIVYETGDNTTVTEGEATPLNLYYSRATSWGDDYDFIEKTDNTGELVEEWDWLENDREILSGEASITANPGGTMFYAVWNQWQEDEHEVMSNSDIFFRRIMYLDNVDAIPTSAILYTSHAMAAYDTGDVLTFVGTGRDNDHVGQGVVGFEWESDLDGVLGSDQILSIPVTDLSIGTHTISFSVGDAEGNWSGKKSVSLFVAETLYHTYLPAILQ